MRIFIAILLVNFLCHCMVGQKLYYTDLNGIADSSSSNQLYIVLEDNYCKLCLDELNEMFGKERSIDPLKIIVLLDSQLIPDYLKYHKSNEIKSHLDHLICDVVFAMPNQQISKEFLIEGGAGKSPYIIVKNQSQFLPFTYDELFEESNAKRNVMRKLRDFLD